ncbi:aminotransferase class III-fold pyridoxal phosphate-dependent enzyme, partial [Chromohalobacter japonicus]|uniref:aminotransferase class III-fold pyridoxal phosphate-dependent enzyme n=1 Tax=Chromohalobacter japonicus TaxID=223900 RepID=UPI003F8E9930
GMPISAVVGTDKVMDASGGNSLGGTYTGSPVSCAATLAVLEVFEEEKILEKSQALGDKLGERFAKWQQDFACVDNVRHLGAMAAFDVVADKTKHTPDAELTGALCKKARERGLVLLSCGLYGNTIRFLMPVTIEDDILQEGLDIIEACLKELSHA